MADQVAAGIAGAWAEIAALAGEAGAGAIRPLFAADPRRFARLSRRAGGLLLDLSKPSLDERRLAALPGLARAAGLEARRAAMAAGEPINATEGRAVLHMALRGEGGFRAGDEDPSAEVAKVLGRMQ